MESSNHYSSVEEESAFVSKHRLDYFVDLFLVHVIGIHYKAINLGVSKNLISLTLHEFSLHNSLSQLISTITEVICAYISEYQEEVAYS